MILYLLLELNFNVEQVYRPGWLPIHMLGSQSSYAVLHFCMMPDYSGMILASMITANFIPIPSHLLHFYRNTE